MRMPGLGLLAAVFAAGCHLCEYRDYRSSMLIDVGLDEPCPPPPSGSQDPPGNHGLVSVDGPGERKVKAAASQQCCYEARFLLEKAEFEGELCTRVQLTGRGDEPGDHCPAADAIRAQADSWSLSHQGIDRSVDRDDVLEVTSGPTPGPVSLRQDTCVYPTTERTTADACG